MRDRAALLPCIFILSCSSSPPRPSHLPPSPFFLPFAPCNAGVYSSLTHLLDLALARVEAHPPSATSCVWPPICVPCTAAAEAVNNAAEEQAKLDAAADVDAGVLLVMGARAGRVTEMLLAAFTAAELRAALDAPDVLQALAQCMAVLLL